MIMSDSSMRRMWSCSVRYLVGRVREKGIAWILRRAPAVIYLWLGFWLGRAIDRLTMRIYRLYQLMGWFFFPPLRMLLHPMPWVKGRLLVIWDFRAAVYSVGDSINLHEVTLILRDFHQLEKVDICFLCDPAHPARSYDGYAQILGITPCNYYMYLGEIVSLAQMNPYLGSLMIFDSAAGLERYVSDNIDTYGVIWPSGWEYFTGAPAYSWTFDFVHYFYRNHGYIPGPPMKASLLKWARYFLREHVGTSIPIVVHMRNVKTPEREFSRNANYDIWREFFDYCVASRYPVTFVVICSRGEIDPRLRECRNVLIAKDFGTTVVQDLALIPVSAMFMGPTSGPCHMAMFSDVPYIITNFRTGRKIVDVERNRDLVFAKPLQRLIWEPATASLLIELFSDLFQRIDLEKWHSDFMVNVPDHDPLQAYGCQLK